MPLTVPELKNAKTRDKPYKLADGGGLYVLITPKGGRLYRYDYRFGGKRKTLAFGGFPKVSITEARSRRDRARVMLDEGVDPGATDFAADQETVADPFEQVARSWFRARTEKWVSSYATRIMGRLEGDIFPAIGSMPIAKIQQTELLAAIRKIEDRGAVELAKRVKNYCNEIFLFAKAEGKCTENPAADLSRALQTPQKKKRRAWIRIDEVPEFMQRLRRFDGDKLTRLALHLTVLTVLRTNEVRFADKREIEDLNGAQPMWRVPGHRMKIKGVTEHLVPLSQQAVAVIREILDMKLPGNYLLPSMASRAGHLSENTMLFAVYRMGFRSRATVHGFRTTFSTAANEARRDDEMRMWDRDAIERQLAHVEQNEVRASYNAAEYIGERRRLMQWWADQVDPIVDADDFDSLM